MLGCPNLMNQVRGKICLRSAHGTHLSCSPEGNLSLSPNMLDWECWTVSVSESQRIILRSIHGKVLKANSDGIFASEDNAGAHLWTLNVVEGTRLTLRNALGTHLQGKPDGSVWHDANQEAWEQFTIVSPWTGQVVRLIPAAVQKRSKTGHTSTSNDWPLDSTVEWSIEDAGFGRVRLLNCQGHRLSMSHSLKDSVTHLLSSVISSGTQARACGPTETKSSEQPDPSLWWIEDANRDYSLLRHCATGDLLSVGAEGKVSLLPAATKTAEQKEDISSLLAQAALSVLSSVVSAASSSASSSSSSNPAAPGSLSSLLPSSSSSSLSPAQQLRSCKFRLVRLAPVRVYHSLEEKQQREQCREPRFRLAWSDEFSGTDLDQSNWTVEGMGDPPNGEVQYYTTRCDREDKSNVWVDDGVLTIEARKEAFGHKQYTSARLKTQGKVELLYGRFEARIKLPSGVGVWPAFWMLGANIDRVGWPACGEIDIMEGRGRVPDWVNAAVHRGPDSNRNWCSAHGWTLPGGPDFTKEFHTFAVEWEHNEVRWYVDNTHYHTTNRPHPSDAEHSHHAYWPFNHGHKFFLLLNVALGGWFDAPHTVDESALPQRMEVMWVRAYSMQPSP